MLICECDLTGISPLGFSKYIAEKKKTGEAHDAFEARSWRQRMHVNKDGHVFIPPGALKNCLQDVAQHLSETVPGKGKATFTKHFKRGILVCDEMLVSNGNGKPVPADKVDGLSLFVPADGVRGGGKRVEKTFPVIQEWSTHAIIHVLDPILVDKPEKVEEYLGFAGQFIGMLWFRPANGGYYGRFTVSNFKSKKLVT